jgi:hypothetical protein
MRSWQIMSIAVAAVVTALTVLVALRSTVWLMLLLGSMTLATLYMIARQRSRFDPLDPRFGSCIPPITRPGDETAVSGRSAPEG